MIVYFSGTTANANQSVTFNGTAYYGDTSSENAYKTVQGSSSSWGAFISPTALTYGGNVLRVDGFTSSTMEIKVSDVSTKWGIAAIQLVDTTPEGKTYTATITESAEFAEIEWDEGQEFEEGLFNTATITVSDDEEDQVYIDFGDGQLKLGTLKIVSSRDVELIADAALPNVSTIDLSECTAKVTYNWPVSALASSDNKNICYAGGTAEGATVAIAHNGGTLNLVGGAYNLSESRNSTATTVNIADSDLTYSDAIGVGTATYNLSGATTLTASKFILSQGAAGRTSVFTMADSAAVTVTGEKIEDSNQSSIMFGHWNGETTFTLQDNATFKAENAQVLVGKTANNHTINLNGGTFTAKGIKASASATGTNTLNLNGGALVLGDIGIASYGSTKINVNVTEDTTITASEATLPITQPISVAADKTLTIDATGADLTLSSTITGEGSILIAGGTYDIGAARNPSAISAQIKLGVEVLISATQTRVEYAQGIASEFTGFTEGQQITLKKLDGSVEELTVDEDGNATSTPGAVHIDGAATLFDVTFTNKEDASQFAYKAVSGATLQYDSTATFYDPEKTVKDIGVYIKHHPYINGAASTFNALGDFTGVFVGEMSATTNRIFVHFGTSYYNDGNGILIATLAEKDAVGVFSNKGGNLTELTKLSVPNAATARHVYIVTKKEVEGNTVFTIYLDGVRRAEKTLEGPFVLGKSNHCGVQVGADFGGNIRTGTYKAVENVDTETGVLNVCRIYDYTLSQAQVTALTTEYPYESEGGLYTRTVDGAAEYAEAATWAKSPSETPEYDVPTGTEQFTPSATLTASEAATVTVNTNSEIDVFTFNGSAMSFVKDADGTNKVVVGTAVVNAPITVEYGAIDLSKAAISLGEDGAVTFDMTKFPIDQYYATTRIQMTGLTDESDSIAIDKVPESAGRSASLDFDDGVYYLVVTVEDHPFVYNGSWTWNGQDVTAETVSNNTAMAITVQSDLEWNIDRDTFTVEGGTLKAAAAPKTTSAVTVEEGAAFDLNGKGSTHYALKLNGGKLANTGAKTFVTGMTVGADSTVEAEDYSISIQSSAEGWAATKVELGENTLAKTGADSLILVATTINGTGTLDIQAGKVYSSESLTFTNGTIKIAKGATFQQRGGRNAYVNKIVGEGGVFENNGTSSGFALSGTLTLTGSGSYGTITMADEAVVTIGTKRGLTFADAGTVNVTLTDAEIEAGTPITLFATNGVTTTAIGTITYSGKDITDKCKTSGNQITELPPFKAKIGTTYYLTFADALDAAEAGDTVTLLKDIELTSTLTLDKAITLDLNENEIALPTAGDGIKVTANATVKNGTLISQLTANTAVYALHSYKTSATYEDLVINGANYRFVVYAEGADTIAACYGDNDPTTTVTCNNVDVTGNGTLFEAEFTLMNLDADCSGIVEGTPWNYAAAIYSAGNATVTIAGGTYTHEKALLSGNLGGKIVVDGGAFTGSIYSWMQSAAHSEYNDDPKYQARFTLNAGTFDGDIEFVENSDDARKLDYFQKGAEVELDAPEGFEWNGDGVLVKKSAGKTVAPGGSPLQVEAESAEAATNGVTIVATSPDASIVSDADYAAYFYAKATETSTPGHYNVYAALKPEIKAAEDETADLASELTAIAGGQTETTITGAKPGLWYSVEYTGDLQTTEAWTEGDRAQAQADGSVTLNTPNAGAATFYTIQVNTADKGTVR